MKKRLLALVLVLACMMGTLATGCNDSDADVSRENLATAAEQFELLRRIVFINGITDEYLYEIQGYCSVETGESGLAGALEVVCRTGGDGENATFKKHFLGLSDNVTYLVEQLDGVGVSTNHYRVIFKPETIVPDFDRP